MPEPSPLQQDLGPALSVILLVSDWSKYGPNECTMYHFRLIDSLALRSNSPASSEGVVGLLECVPTKHWLKISKENRRTFKRIVKRFKGTYHFPLLVTPQSQVSFAYETTRIAFVLDASPTLTSTYGFSSNTEACCPLDHVSELSRRFFASLVQPIQCQYRSWRPEMAITVLAVFPQSSGDPPISLLVRDYRITDQQSVDILLDQLDKWCFTEVETEIAKRMGKNTALLLANVSSLQDLLDAGQAALTTLSSAAQPRLILATDSRAVVCDSVIDFVTSEPEVLKTPISILDLRPSVVTNESSSGMGHNLLNYDPNGAALPLHLSDDSEALRNICSATLGQFWDMARLREASNASFDEVGKRHSILLNTVQWHTLLRLSDFGPGRLPPPSQARVTVSTYFINPIPLNQLVLMRITEGYRVKQYRASEADFLSVHFALFIGFGTTIHYEISYKPSNSLVGATHIHIDLSGNAHFVRSVKNSFVHNNQIESQTTTEAATKLCTYLRSVRKTDLLQSYLAPVQWSDHLDSAATPFVRRLATLSILQRKKHFHADYFDCVCTGNMPWETPTTFLSEFRDDDDGSEQLLRKLQEWATQQIDWCHFVRQTNPDCGVGGYCVVELKRSTAASRLVSVIVETFTCIPSLQRQEIIEDLKETLGQLKCIHVLEKQMAPYLVGDVVGEVVDHRNAFHQRVLQGQHNRASWDLVKDPELIPLVMRRRKEIGGFHLLEANENYALFAKLKLGEHKVTPGDQVQYELFVQEDKVTVQLHMEGESGIFSPLGSIKSMHHKSQFHRMVRTLRTREKECSQALRCRTRLLSLFDEASGPDCVGEPITVCIRKLLEYGSSTSRALRFFKPGNEKADSVLEELTSDTIMSVSSNADVRAVRVPVGRWNSANWFIVEHDKQTISIVNLSSKSSIGDDGPVRELIYHTVSISDLYSRRDDMVEEDNEDDHISERLQVVEICESVGRAHRYNFAAAAYTGLVGKNNDIEKDDFAEVLCMLDFVEVTQVPVPPELGGTLADMLSSVLCPVSCAPGYFVYEPPDDVLSFPTLNEDSELASVYGMASSADSGIVVEEGGDSTHPTISDGGSVAEMSGVDFDASEMGNKTPIFVSFLKDDIQLLSHEVLIHGRSARVSVLLSVFKGAPETQGWRKVDPTELDPTHVEAALQLSTVLNAYVAGQNLERLRYIGADITDADARLAKAYLRKARNVTTTSVEAFFYSTKQDAIVAASLQTSEINNETTSGFDLLARELTQLFTPYGSRDSLMSKETHVLGYLLNWNFIKIMRASHSITVEVHHPDGLGHASVVRDATVAFIFRSCHRVNQILILRSLLQSRMASRLLIPPTSTDEGNRAACDQDEEFDGSFSCDIMYRTSFQLYHRLATNTSQVARQLISGVLQNFAISNRSGFFVYKDESGSVFYLNLSVSSEHGKEQIELIVRGLNSPGPSITVQMVNLLQKRLLLIAVDLLSTVLTKNHWYGWKQKDIDFIHSFRSEWALIDDRKSDSDQSPASRMYKLPDCVSDPTMLLLLFRQNICGSFFFFPLQTGEDAFHHPGIEIAPSNSEEVRIKAVDLRFFFNASKSKLDPAFQAESTLTERGREISRQLSSGIAIVYVSLVQNVKEEAVMFRGKTSAACRRPVSSLKELRLKEAGDESPGYHFRVTVVDTNHKHQLIHEWVLLTLNQVIIAWVIEQHIERLAGGLFLPALEDARAMLDRKQENLVPGLPFLIEILDDALDLPHPAVKCLQVDGAVRSSTVSLLALELLRSMASDFGDGKTKLDDADLQQSVIRSSRFGDPEFVRLERGQANEVFVHRQGGSESTIKDSPLDCVEYTVLFLSLGNSGNSKVFEDVSIAFSKSEVSEESAAILNAYKEKHPSLFYRSFGFILTVKRNFRRLTAYNWNAKLVERVFSKLREVNRLFSSSTATNASSLMRGSLGLLAPHRLSETESSENTKEMERPPASISSARGATQKTHRSQPLKRPKLVGKSVEGSAIKAVEFSRARASSKRPGAKQAMSRGANTRAPSLKKDTSQSSKHCGKGIAEDKDSVKLENALTDLCSGAAAGQTRERSAWQKSATTVAWPIEPPYKVKLSAAQTLFRTGVLSWYEAAPILPIPRELSSRFLPSLARTLSAWNPSLLPIDLDPAVRNLTEQYLMSKPERVGNDLYFFVTRLSIVNQTPLKLVTSETRAMSSRRNFRLKDVRQATFERHAAHVGFLSGVLHRQVNLPSNLLDHVCVEVEEAMKSLLMTTVEHADAHEAVKSIVDRVYPLEHVLSLPSRFKVFKASIVLKSYSDRLIDQFEGQVLLKWLSKNAATVNMINCGQGLCFRRQISAFTTASTCLLGRDSDQGSRGKLILLFLCRTNGRNLNDFVFREGSDTAVSILDNIAMEGAALAYQALRLSATSLRRDQLWSMFSTGRSVAPTPTEALLSEFLRLSNPKLLTQFLNEDDEGLHQLLDHGSLLNECFEEMIDEESFSPSWRFREQAQPPHYLYYLADEEMFLFAHQPTQDDAPALYLVNRGEHTSIQKANDGIEKFVNFLFHFVWCNI